MTFLPIVERELRMRARSGATYWTRFAAVLVGVLICLPQLALSGPFTNPTQMGKSVFDALVALAFLGCCCACLTTADAISSERREGTLGLLFLTRVKCPDVLVGKLCSAGMTDVCALVAFLPLLVIPVLGGGVTGGEAFRKGLVLIDTLFLSLAAGLWISASRQERFKVARDAVLLVALLVLAPAIVSLVSRPAGGRWSDVGLLSPLVTTINAGDVAYKLSAARYWISLGAVQGIGWLFVFGAGLRLRRDLVEVSVPASPPPPPPPPPKPYSTDPFSNASHALANPLPKPRPPLVFDEAHPVEWLVRRQRGLKAMVWTAALIGAANGFWSVLIFRFLGSATAASYTTVIWPLSLGIAVIQSSLFAWAASRFFVEARRTGELELLLTTPLGAKAIVSDQWQSLKRLFLWPVLVLLMPILWRFVTIMTANSSSWSTALPYHVGVISIFSAVNTCLGAAALCWLGLWFGLKARGQAAAILWTIGLGSGVPYLFTSLLQTLFILLFRTSILRGSSLFAYAGAWPSHVLTLLFYLWLIRLAKRRLAQELAGAGPPTFNLSRSISNAARDTAAAIRAARHWTPS